MHRSFLKQFPLFIWLLFAVSSVSDFRDLLFRLASSVPLRGGRGAADRHRCVWGALTVFWPHWVCPAHGCVLSPSALLRLPAALYGAGPALRAVPVFGYPTKARTRLRLHFVPSPAGAPQAARSLRGALSPGAAAFSLRSPSLSFCVLRLGASGLCLFSGAGL